MPLICISRPSAPPTLLQPCLSPRKSRWFFSSLIPSTRGNLPLVVSIMLYYHFESEENCRCQPPPLITTGQLRPSTAWAASSLQAKLRVDCVHGTGWDWAVVLIFQTWFVLFLNLTSYSLIDYSQEFFSRQRSGCPI